MIEDDPSITKLKAPPMLTASLKFLVTPKKGQKPRKSVVIKFWAMARVKKMVNKFILLMVLYSYLSK